MLDTIRRALVLLFFITGLYCTHRLLQRIIKHINNKASLCLGVVARFTAAVLRALEYDIKPLVFWTVHNQKQLCTKTVQLSFHVNDSKEYNTFKPQKRQLTSSKATTLHKPFLSATLSPPPQQQEIHQNMNVLTPLKGYETQTRTGLLSIYRGPLSLPPSCPLPPPPPPPPHSSTTFGRRNPTSASPFFRSSSSTTMRRRPQQCHPLTQNTRLQPLTPIYPIATSSVPPQISLSESCTENPELQTVEDKETKTAIEEEEEEQLELNWRSMLEMFPRPRTYSQTARYLAKQRMGMMGSAA